MKRPRVQYVSAYEVSVDRVRSTVVGWQDLSRRQWAHENREALAHGRFITCVWASGRAVAAA